MTTGRCGIAHIKLGIVVAQVTDFSVSPLPLRVFLFFEDDIPHRLLEAQPHQPLPRDLKQRPGITKARLRALVIVRMVISE